jgi:hypothetical protein
MQSALLFFGHILFKDIIYVNYYFADIVTVAAGTTITICTWLTKQYVAFKH